MNQTNVLCDGDRQPNLLSITWCRRNRRLVTEPKIWEPTMKNPLKGLVVWAVPENKEATITLFGDPRSQEFEDKMWTFILEDVSSTGFTMVTMLFI